MNDDGTGQIGTIAGFTAFLALLFLAVHVLVGLYATSTVTAAAQSGARRVAQAPIDRADGASVLAARADAEEHVRSLLGRAGARATFEWAGSTMTVVSLRIVVPWPRLLPALGGPLGARAVDRTVVVRVETRR